MSTTNLKISFPFHPFLFVFLSPLVFFINSINAHFYELYPADLVLPTLLILIPTILLWLGFRFFFKSSTKSGLLVSLIVILFLSYGLIFKKLNEMTVDFEIQHQFFLVPFLGIFILGFLYCLKTKRKLNNITTILNVITIAFIAALLAQLIAYDFNPYHIFEDDIDTSTQFHLTDSLDEYPDIYYIILDEYAGSKILNDRFDYDNSEFTDYLYTNGFTVPLETQSNYFVSFLSLSSSLNMQYVNFYADEVGVDARDPRLSYNLIHNNRTMQILESNGYSTISFDSNWGPTNAIKIANQNLCEKSPAFNSELLTMVLSNSMLNPIYVDLLLPSDRERVLCIFSEIPEIQFESKKPIFVLAHIMLPHGPYAWGPNGEHKKIVSLSVLDIEESKKGYLDQLAFTNKMVQEMIEKIIDEKKRPKIIIIQSDHGTTDYDWINTTENVELVEAVLSNPSKFDKHVNELVEQKIHERFSNINYILLPDKNKNSLYNTMTPVNTFRVLFNDYFNTNFEILEDRVFFSSYHKPYNFIDVTHLF